MCIRDRFRRSDEEIDEAFAELTELWDALIAVRPDMKNQPSSMRVHDDELEGEDSALFWPITQKILAEIARRLMDDYENKTPEEALQPLADLEMSLHAAPWRNLVLVPSDATAPWKMRNEDRKPAMNVLNRIIQWQLGLVPGDDELMNELRMDWDEYVYGGLSKDEKDDLWDQILEGRIA